MSIIFITILTLFLIKLLRDSLYFAWLWQVKEYRMDRMRSYLKENGNIIKNNLLYIFAIIIFILYFVFLKNNLLIFQCLVLVFFIISFLQILREIKKRSFLRPKPTLKVILIFSIMIIFYFLLFAIYWIPASAGMTNIETAEIIKILLFIYIINSLVISSIVLAINPIFNFQKRRLIKKATIKTRGLKKMKVIGITGSYGKTSTKEFLHAILSEKYKVIRTTGNNNTNIGVAYTVLNKVSDEYDYFICEMGAYKIGEIAEICNIVKPKIGILTGINEQHLDLFGSIENTIKAKSELIEALPEDGMAIINSRIKNLACWQAGQELRIKNKKYFSIDNVRNIKVYQDYMEFDFQNQIFKLNLLGKHYIENVLSAIMTAEYLGMNLDEIKNAIEKIKPAEFMMRKLNGPNNSIFIDDSYSANPDGVLAALNYLDEAYQDYKKIIVFPGIIELGSSSKKIHKKLFSRIDEVCDTAYILNTEYRIPNIKNNCKFIFEKDFYRVVEMLKNNLDEKTVVLFESRGAGVVMGKII